MLSTLSPEYLTDKARAESAARIRAWMDDDADMPIPMTDWGRDLAFDLQVVTYPFVANESGI
jgi:hypothetical protein